MKTLQPVANLYPPTKLFLKVDEVAELLAVKPNTIYRWMETGYLPSVKLGRNRRIPVDALDRFLDEHIYGSG